LQLGSLVVDQLRVLTEDVVSAVASRMLQAEDRLRVEQVRRTVTAPLVLAAGPEPLVRAGRGVLRVGVVMTGLVLGEDVLDPDATELRLGSGEVRVDELLAEPDR